MKPKQNKKGPYGPSGAPILDRVTGRGTDPITTKGRWCNDSWGRTTEGLFHQIPQRTASGKKLQSRLPGGHLGRGRVNKKKFQIRATARKARFLGKHGVGGKSPEPADPINEKQTLFCSGTSGLGGHHLWGPLPSRKKIFIWKKKKNPQPSSHTTMGPPSQMAVLRMSYRGVVDTKKRVKIGGTSKNR